MRALLWSALLYLFIASLFVMFLMLAEWHDPILVKYRYNGSLFVFFCEYAVYKGAVGAIPVFWFCYFFFMVNGLFEWGKGTPEEKDKIKEHFGIDYKKKD